jgi:mono/diheme cytochrome c family protein
MKFFQVITSTFFLAIPVSLYAQNTPDVKSSVDRGKAVFEQTCLACHQADGSGVPHLAPPLIKAAFVGDKTKAISIVLHGLENAEIKGEYYSSPMPSFDYLSDEEVADVLTFVRSNFSNDAGPVRPEDVATVRKADTQK